MSIVYELLGGLQWGNWISGVGIGECVFAIIVMLFIKQAEPIVRKIFGFDNASSLGSAIASGALLMGSMKTASNAINKNREKNKKGTNAGKGNSSKPQPSSNANRNTTNINNTNSGTTTPNQNSSATPQNGQGTSKGSTPQGSGQNSTTQSNQPGNRNLDTSRIGESEDEKKKKRNERIKKAIGTGVGIGFRATGLAMGAFASDDAVTGGITGFGYGTAFGEGAKALGGKAAGAGKKIANKATRRRKLNEATNNLIDGYNKIKSKSGWDDQMMYKQSEALLQVRDLNKVNNPDMRSYGETLHKYREAFESRYNNPDDMVLNAIDKIGTGELEKTDESVKRYTRRK